MFVAFSALTCWAASHGLATEIVIATTAGTLLGPFTGAIAREWQACCAANSWSLLPYAAIELGVCLLVQVAPLPSGTWWERLRLFAWSLGWLAWFGSGILSLGHALE